MCTLALYFRCFDIYPLLAAANRDESFDRPSSAPALQHTRPKILAGKDLRAGGTWFGVNEYGVMVGILNRRIDGRTLPATAVRSRGLLCLDLLQFENVEGADHFLAAHDVQYNPFTVVCADREGALVAYNNEAKVIIQHLNPGLHVFSSAATLDLNSAKADRAYERFAGLLQRHREYLDHSEEWLRALQTILADHSVRDGSENPSDAVCVHRENAGTVSSSVAFLAQTRNRFETFHCPGAPCRTSFAGLLPLPLR